MCCIPSTHLSAMATISSNMVFVAAIPSPALGLPQLRVGRAERLGCRFSKKASSALAPVVAKGVPLLAVVSTTAASAAPMLAVVDERMSSEGTGLSNDLLGWILLVAIGLVLCFYTVYASTFDDDDQSVGGGITL